MVGGEMVMMEADEDGDGFFETTIVYRPSKSDMEVFTRSRDGSVTPVSAHTLAAYKKQHAAITELWDHAFDKDTDADKFIDRMQDTQRKIRDAEKEKKDEKK
jgi:ABC-type Fe3+-hydroxamate transport system substrate-binding protein